MRSCSAFSLEAAVRAEWPLIVAGLLRTTGDWDLSTNPAAWLTSVARRRALDALRRRNIESRVLQAWSAVTEDTASTFDAGL